MVWALVIDLVLAIGLGVFWNFDADFICGEIGYELNRAYGRNRIMAEALPPVLSYGLAAEAWHLGGCLLALDQSTCHTGTDAVAFWHLFWRFGPPANFRRSLGVAANERLAWHDCPVQPAGRAKGRPCSDLRRRSPVLGL